MKRLSLLTGLALILTGCGQAPENTTPTKPQPVLVAETSIVDRIQPVVDKSSKGQYRVTKSFPGPDGLVGLLLESNSNGNKIIAWTSPNAEVLMAGPLFDKKGDNLSDTLLTQQADFLSVDKLADALVGEGFVVGTAGPVITVLFEPYCGYCSKLLKEVDPMIDQGKLRMRVVMVGFLRSESVARAAEIAGSDNPHQALLDWEKRKDKATAPAPKSPPQEALARVQKVNELINQVGEVGTPAILVCKKDKTLDFVRGLPSDIKTFLAGVGDLGHPLCGNAVVEIK